MVDLNTDLNSEEYVFISCNYRTFYCDTFVNRLRMKLSLNTATQPMMFFRDSMMTVTMYVLYIMISVYDANKMVHTETGKSRNQTYS